MGAADVDLQVQQKINSVDNIISVALESSSTFLESLEDLEDLRPPFYLPNPQIYTPDTIPIDAIKPTPPDDLDTVVKDLKSGTMDQFSAKDIVIPNANEIIPDSIFTSLPSLDEFVPEEGYSSDLLDALKAKLQADIEDGATGLSAEAEDAIWARRGERDDQAWTDAADKFRGQWAAGGFELPDGVLAAGILDLATKQADANQDRSRDITSESFKMAVENNRFAVTQGIVLESALMQHFNNVADRAQKFVLMKTEFALKLFVTVVEAYKAREEARLANVRLQVESEKGRIEVFLGQLQKMKVDAEVAGLKVDAYVKKYSIDIEAYKAELSKAEVSGRITVEQQRIAAQNYLAALQAGLQQAKANLETFVQVAGIKVNAAVAGGNIYANYIAAAINSLNAVMTISTSAETTKFG